MSNVDLYSLTYVSDFSMLKVEFKKQIFSYIEFFIFYPIFIPINMLNAQNRQYIKIVF